MGKTRTQQTSQTIDPQIARESHKILNLFRLMASGGYQPNRGVTIADFTPAQKAAFSMNDAASQAFGFAPTQPVQMPQAEVSASGIQGFRPSVEYDASMAALPPEYRALMEQFYKEAGEQTEYKQYKPKKRGKK